MVDVTSALVLITSADQRNETFGTGFVVEPVPGSFHVVTCAHVVRDAGGPEAVLVRGRSAEIVVIGDGDGIDLAVLRMDGIDDTTPLVLGSGGSGLNGRHFHSAGFHAYSGGYLVRETAGVLASEAILEDRAHTARVRAWELVMGAGNRLRPGCSGSPVVDRESGNVVAIVSHREGDGQRGLAISVAALDEIWPRARGAIGPVDAQRPPTPIFVGRARELEALKAGAAAALDGCGSIGFVMGEAGAGKSGLVAKLLSEFQGEGRFITATAAADAIAGKRVSYGPFKDFMEQILAWKDRNLTVAPAPIDLISEALSGMGITDLGPLTSFAGRHTRSLNERLVASSSGYGDSGQRAAASIDRDSLFDCYAKAIFAVCQQYPLLLVIEDLHWVDDSSLLLLMHIARMVGSNRLFILCTARPEDACENPLFTELQDALGSRGAFTLDLENEGLGAASEEKLRFCSEYLLARYGTTFTAELPGILYKLTRANPLFLTEILGYLEDRGLITSLDGRWKLVGSIDDIHQLPSRIEHVIRHRMNRLDDTLASILKCGSVEGHNFTLEVISRIQGIEQRALLRTIIDKLVRAHHLVISGLRYRLYNGVRIHIFSFHHIMAQRYVYEYLLTPIERQMLHEEVATCLEELWSDSAAEIAPQLATHFSLAGEAQKTIEYALIAGESFVREYGWSEVVKFARLGLSAWQENSYLAHTLGAETFVRLCLLNAKGEVQGGIRSEAKDHIQAGIDILLPCLAELDKVERSLAAQVNLVLGQLIAAKQVTSEYNGNQYVTEAVRIFEELDDTEGVIAALSVASYDTNLADQSAADQQLQNRLRCVALAEGLGQPILLAKSLSDLALHYLNFDSAEENPLGLALEIGRRAVDVAAEQNAIAELDARLIVSWVRHHSGHYEELPVVRQEVLELARRHGQTIFEAEALTDIAHYYSLTMDGREFAEPALRAALEFRIRIGRHAVHDRENLAAFLFRTGRFHEAVELLEELATEGDTQRVARARAAVATIFALTGRTDEAAAVIDEVERALAEEGKPGDVCTRMLAHAHLGQRAKALALTEEAEKNVYEGVNRGLFHVYADTATCLAEVYLKFGEVAAARRWIDVAAKNWTRLAETTNVHSLVMYWEHRLVEGEVVAGEGDRAEAVTTLEEVARQLARFGHYREAECRSWSETAGIREGGEYAAAERGHQVSAARNRDSL